MRPLSHGFQPLWAQCNTLFMSLIRIVPPLFQIGISNGKFDTLGGLEPSLKWTTSGKFGDIDVQVSNNAFINVTCSFRTANSGHSFI